MGAVIEANTQNDNTFFTLTMANVEDLIKKEGSLEKKSRFLGIWRKRWTVLEPNATEHNYYVSTYKKPKQYRSPTEHIRIDDDTNIELHMDKNDSRLIYFFVENKSDKEKFLFRARTKDERDEWIKCIINMNQHPLIENGADSNIQEEIEINDEKSQNIEIKADHNLKDSDPPQIETETTLKKDSDDDEKKNEINDHINVTNGEEIEDKTGENDDNKEKEIDNKPKETDTNDDALYEEQMQETEEIQKGITPLKPSTAVDMNSTEPSPKEHHQDEVPEMMLSEANDDEKIEPKATKSLLKVLLQNIEIQNDSADEADDSLADIKRTPVYNRELKPRERESDDDKDESASVASSFTSDRDAPFGDRWGGSWMSDTGTPKNAELDDDAQNTD